jgi:orotidine-5'-phosphate decarboxylase
MHQHTVAGTGSDGIRQALRARWRRRSFVCVGLDSAFDRLPESVRRKSADMGEAIVEFNREIVEATHECAAAYKPNAAFYEQHGAIGVQALIETVQYIKNKYPDIPVILDAKRGDIGNTNAGYARSAFDVIGVDAITLHPYLGSEALRPFLDRVDRGLFILVKTSNPGAGEFQDLPFGPDQRPFYEHVAETVAERWNGNGNCGVVVGAPYPDALRTVRGIVGDLPILVPGIGAQGGELQATIEAGRDSEGFGMVVNAARSIIFASSEADYAEAAAVAAERLNTSIGDIVG